MKKLLALCIFAWFSMVPSPGHSLTRLWKQYEQACQADLPQKEAAILSQIKAEALKQHLPLDFYDAATAYVTTVQRRDWKQRDSLRAALSREVKAFDEPIVTFRWMQEWENTSADALWAFVQAHPDGFQGRNPGLYEGVSSYLGGTLEGFIVNDREYVLWRLLRSRNAAVTEALQAQVQGHYPNEAALACHLAGDSREALQSLAVRYAGKAVSLYPRAQLLLHQMDSLDQRHSRGEAYQALYRQARRLEEERKAYTGTEARIAAGCTYPAMLQEILTDSRLQLRVEKGQALVIMQNLSRARFTLRSGEKQVFTQDVTNPIGSFYVKDTLSVALPSLPDGEYQAEAVSGRLTDEASYSQYTLSIATRTDSRGPCVYVARYDSGEPLEQVTLLLQKRGREVARSILQLDGFTPLPPALQKSLDEGYYTLQALSGDQRSRSVGLPGHSPEPFACEERPRCLVYKDQGAYRPGDTLRFQVLLFESDAALARRVCPQRSVDVRLHDTENHLIGSQALTTNAWGTASGQFVLPRGLRNGYFELEVEGLASEYFRVDEFALPSFDLRFDPLDGLFLVGDSIPVSGSALSYSGHSLSGMSLQARVSRHGERVCEQRCSLEDGEHFHFSFLAGKRGYYTIEIQATDATGETRRFSQGIYVGEKLSLDARPVETFTGTIVPKEEEGISLLSTDLRMRLEARDENGRCVPLPIRYRLLQADGRLLTSGTLPSGDTLCCQLPGSGTYRLETRLSVSRKEGDAVEADRAFPIYCVLPRERQLPAQLSRLCLPGPLSLSEGEAVSVRLASGEGKAYVLALLYGEAGQVLDSRKWEVPRGEIATLSFPYRETYPDAVRLQLFYFLQGEAVLYDWQYSREKDRYILPLAFTRIQDQALPGTLCELSWKTAPGAELLFAAWDKSLDAIAPNRWPVPGVEEYVVNGPSTDYACGSVGSPYQGPVILRGMATKNAWVQANAMTDRLPASMAEEESAPMPEAAPRVHFASSLSFQPQLHADADGRVHCRFRTSDKLSTFYLRAFAHDPAMHHALVESELVVSLPVQVALLPPRFLYEGDVYEALVSVSSLAGEPVSGVLSLQAGDSEQQLPLTLAPGENQAHAFRIAAARVPSLQLTAAFRSDRFSDAVQLEVPVYPAAQQLAESHSAVLRAGMDREALLDELRARFVNLPASQAALREISVKELVREAIPSHVEPRGKDVLSLSEAWYMRLMATRLGAPAADNTPLLDAILACRQTDGGFAWFEGMTSSAVITAVLLERVAKLRDRGFEVPDLSTSVHYLDQVQFGAERPAWRGGISDAQYLYIRSLYPSVPFAYQAQSAGEKKRLKEFRRWAKRYLTPSSRDGRGLQGQILEKSRRLLTLRNLLDRENCALRKARLQKSLEADVRSLREYAVEHRDGGWYYPNAVQPWRGLMESEAYAHALLCDLLAPYDPALADGIRLWLMLQKETQHWDSEPAYIDALTAILDGSEALLDTRVLALSGSYEAPFAAVKASGNGFTVERKCYKGNEELREGSPVSLGDRIRVQYRIWNGENRSFVRITAGREASLQPVDQLSGYRSGGYRNVKAGCTEYYFDTYPEENTVLEESFFVQQSGVFTAPVVVIESLYAPHYRANTAYRPPLQVLGK